MFTRKKKAVSNTEETKRHNGETSDDAKATKTHSGETTETAEEKLARTAMIKEHNEKTLAKATPGDMLKFDRGIYSHWGLYIGEGRVIHLAGSEGDMNSNASDVKVREDSFWKVAEGDMVDVSNDKDGRWNPYPSDEIVERATSRLGRVGYNLVLYNCEHFTSWCRYGKSQSDQVDRVAAAGSEVFGGGVMQIYDIFKSLVNPS